ncbi:MAG: P-loop containing nucleoside triphosphate hydrolase protein, partial [Podila humilis]
MDLPSQNGAFSVQDGQARRQSLLQRLPKNTLHLCKKKLGVAEPKDDQLEVVARIGECRDTILIAGCGWGKSLVFHLPLVIWEDKIMIIITPLTALGNEQSKRLNDKGIKSINLKESEEVSVDQLIAGKYRAVFMSPEILFKSTRYTALWHQEDWMTKLVAIVIDEAHCVSTWETFRTSYLRIRELRYKVNGTTCFVALSATLPPFILAKVRKELCFKTVKEINVGNDRANIKYIVRKMLSVAERRERRIQEMKEQQMSVSKDSEAGPEPISRFQCLEFLQDKVKTIVYFNSRSDADEATKYLQRFMGDEHVGCYHAGKSEECKESRMDDFIKNKLCVLMATEAAGMGCDLSDVLRVVQFGFPDSLSTLMQRLGRSAR